jgi:4-alpha-glucanotransferase
LSRPAAGRAAAAGARGQLGAWPAAHLDGHPEKNRAWELLIGKARDPRARFSETGQFWGYPPYRWEVMAQTGFAWWQRRFEIQARRFDLVRLDHFRGFAAWWRIPQGARSAAEGAWTPGPGRAAIDALAPVLGGAQLVAEDLGVITEDVIAMRQALGIPGMRVLQFAFDGNPHNPHLPASHGPDTICYTGTHDNDTTLGLVAQRARA